MGGEFFCSKCAKSFQTKFSHSRHMQNKHALLLQNKKIPYQIFWVFSPLGIKKLQTPRRPCLGNNEKSRDSRL